MDLESMTNPRNVIVFEGLSWDFAMFKVYPKVSKIHTPLANE